MTRVGLVILTCLSLLLPFSALAQEALRVGSFLLPPHSQPNQAQYPAGAAADYFRRIAARMGVQRIAYSHYPLPRLLRALEMGQIDLILILARTAERERRFSYPQQPLIVTQPALVLLRESPLQRVERVEDLLPLRLATWQDGQRAALMNDPRQRLTLLSGDDVLDKALRMLQAHRIDAIYVPESYSLMAAVQRQGLAGRIKLLPLPGAQVELYTVFSRQGARRYLQDYERALQEVQRTQTYKQYLESLTTP